LVEATLRAIEEYGPDLSIDDVVRTADIPRPKLYRYFEDKDTLFAAVGERVQELVLERVVPHFDLSGTSHFRDGGSAARLLDGGRRLADVTVPVVATVVKARGGDAENLEYFVDAVLGAVALGVLRWLNEPTIDKDALVEEMTVIVWGAMSATATARGVTLEPNERLS
jgi:AcrR family transcriptional regulator